MESTNMVSAEELSLLGMSSSATSPSSKCRQEVSNWQKNIHNSSLSFHTSLLFLSHFLRFERERNSNTCIALSWSATSPWCENDAYIQTYTIALNYLHRCLYDDHPTNSNLVLLKISFPPQIPLISLQVSDSPFVSDVFGNTRPSHSVCCLFLSCEAYPGFGSHPSILLTFITNLSTHWNKFYYICDTL